GEDFLPRYQCLAGYRLHKEVTSDWDRWHDLLPAGPTAAPTEALEQALSLVRGRPFDGVRCRRHAWAETLKQQMISAIVDAAHAPARRGVMGGPCRGAGAAVGTGLSGERGMERLWRVRILAAYAGGNQVALQAAVDRLLAIAGELGGDLEQPTEDLLEQLV